MLAQANKLAENVGGKVTAVILGEKVETLSSDLDTDTVIILSFISRWKLLITVE